eukprot:scaffold173222_cov30-Tisochrysis_lutea.AAC.2
MRLGCLTCAVETQYGSGPRWAPWAVYAGPIKCSARPSSARRAVGPADKPLAPPSGLREHLRQGYLCQSSFMIARRCDWTGHARAPYLGLTSALFPRSGP